MRKGVLKRCIVVFILIILNFTLQSTLLSPNDLSGITGNLLMVLTVSFGLMRGRKEGMLIGFFSGMLMDMYLLTVMGPFMFLYMSIGYLAGYFEKNFSSVDVSLPMLCAFVSEAIYNIYIIFLFFILQGRLNFMNYFKSVFIPDTLITTLIMVFLYKLYYLINVKLKEGER